MATLKGTLSTVTSKAPETFIRAYVKAPSARVGGSGVITTSPATVDVDTESGDLTIRGISEGLSWLVLEGVEWSDRVNLVVAKGMTTLVEAIANATGVPSMGDYLQLINNVEDRTQSYLNALVAGTTTKYVGYENYASKVVSTGEDGKINISTDSISDANDAINKKYLENYVASASFARGDVSADTNINEYWLQEHAGVWQVPSRDVAEALDLPDPYYGALAVIWAAGNTPDYANAIQWWLPSDTENVYMRKRKSKRQWTPWVKNFGVDAIQIPEIEPIPEPLGAFGAPRGRDNLLKCSRGGILGTAGKAVVTLRFDHNLGGFDNLLPLLRERGLPSTMACFYEMMDPQPGYSNDDSVAAGKTWEDIQQNFYRGVEVFSHSYSHQDAKTLDELRHEIVESRIALEKKLPDIYIHGWLQPGVGDTKYMGWTAGDWDDPNTRLVHPAGQLLGNTYATYNVGGQGLNTLGAYNFRHITIEKRSESYVTEIIDQAIGINGGVTLMCHPNRIGQSGYMSIDTFTRVLDYIVEKRDAGELMVLTQGGQASADPSTPYRHSLTPTSPDRWEGTRDGTLTFTINTARLPDNVGVVREFTVTTEGAGQVRLKAEAAGVNMTTYQTIDVEDSHTARLQVGLPKRATSLTLTAEITATSVKEIGFYAV